MGERLVFEAVLKNRTFVTGARQVEASTERMISSVNRATLAFRHFQRGNIERGFTHLGIGARQAGMEVMRLGQMGYAAGRRIFDSFTGVLGLMKTIATRVTILGAIFAGLGTATVMKAAAFEAEVSRAAILSQATPAQREEMRKHAMAVGIETPFGIMGAAESMKVEAQRGRTPEQIIALTEATKKFAVIANIDMAQAAEVISQVMFQFDMPMERATETALKLSNAVTATALSGHEMYDALKFAGGAAGVMKVNLTELLAVLGTLRRVTDPTVASTALRNIMLIASAMKEKKPKQLAELGLSEEDASKFTFMSGGDKSLVDVVSGITKVFEAEPEMAMKAGFGTRTIIALKQIAEFAGRAGGFFETLKARIDDTDLAERQYAQSVDLLDNRLKRVKSNAEAIFVTLGNKVIDVFGVSEGVDKLNDALGDIQNKLENMSEEDFRKIVDSLGAGMIQAFQVALQALLEGFIAIAPAMAEVMVKAVSGAIKGVFETDATRSYRMYYEKFYDESTFAQRNAELDRLKAATKFGGNAVDATRLSAFRDVIKGRTDTSTSGLIDLTLSKLGRVGEHALDNLSRNPTVRAVGAGLSNAEIRQPGWMERASQGRGGGGAVDIYAPGIDNHGTIMLYGAPSSSQRAKPPRAAGVTPQERAGR